MNAEPKADAHQKATAADAGMTKFDANTLKSIESTALVASNGSAFLPTSMAEAMELGKLISLSNFVPPHLRGKAGDCLAVVMQATRWGMDPFAVANKTYFVNDRMAYEAQLVGAVLNARAPLEGRLKVEWDGEGQTLTCKVTGKIKGDPEPHTVWQEIATITTRNSPLWKTSPRQQLAYYTTRMWARLFCPEVLLGVYTEDEVREMGPIQESVQVIPPRPMRAANEEGKRQAEEASRKGTYEMDRQYRDTMRETLVDGETGEVIEEKAEQRTAVDHVANSKVIVGKLNKAGTLAMVDAIVADFSEEIEAMRTDPTAAERYEEVSNWIKSKRQGLKK